MNMRTINLLLSFLVIPATSNPVEKRQLGNLAGLLPIITPIIAPLKPVSKEYPKPDVPGDKIKRVVLKYGPFKLRAPKTAWQGNALSLDPQGTAYAYMAKDFPSNITVLLPKMLIVHEDGSEISNVNRVYNHHAFVYDVSRAQRANIQCKDVKRDLNAVNALMGSSADFNAASLQNAATALSANWTKPGAVRVGNYINKSDQMLISADLVNYNPEPKNVYMVADLTYLEGKAVGYYETAIHLISVGTCESNAFLGGLFVRPPKDHKQWYLHGEAVAKDDGKILAIRGHMHDGGENMTLKVNGRVVCDTKAVYEAGNVGAHGTGAGMTGMLSDMTMCLKPIDVKKGDTLTMDANYDMEKYESRAHPGGGMTEQMALMAIVFAQELK